MKNTLQTVTVILAVMAACLVARPAAAQTKVVPQGGFFTLQSGGAATNLWLPVTVKHTWYTVSAYNASASDIYLMAFDTNTTNVANGAVPSLEVVRVPSSSTGGWSEPAGMVFNSGLLVMSSTTPFTLTNSAAAIQARASFYR
jgi:hypothetical protein